MFHAMMRYANGVSMKWMFLACLCLYQFLFGA